MYACFCIDPKGEDSMICLVNLEGSRESRYFSKTDRDSCFFASYFVLGEKYGDKPYFSVFLDIFIVVNKGIVLYNILE